LIDLKSKAPFQSRNSHENATKKRCISPGRLISLWEIVNTLHASKFARTWEKFQTIKLSVEAAAASDPSGFLGDQELSRLYSLVQDLRQFSMALDTPRSFDQILHLEDTIDAGGPFLCREIASLLVAVDEKIMIDLRTSVFVQIPAGKARLYDQEALFEESVFKSFEQARADIKAAGNCLALGLNTAAVFHLMRVVEFGMRDLAEELGVRWKHKTVETADWGMLIKGIRNRIALRQKRFDKSKRKKKGENEILRFYSGLVDEMNVFRENWRNNTMHTRGFYNASEADGVYIRVRDFMLKLARRERPAD